MKMLVRAQLAAMMFLEYAAWGAWTPVLGATLDKRLHATGAETGAIYGILWLACIITPFIGGQLVDRLMPSQTFLGIASLLCAGSAWKMSQAHTVAEMMPWMWIWSLAFAPTLGITNSIAFHHIGRLGASEEDQERDFAVIRTAGTIGWIAAAFVLTTYLIKWPAASTGVTFVEMQVAAVFSLILAIMAFALPNTPPARESASPWAFTRAFALFRTVPGFLTFMVISLIVSTEFQFFYVLSAPFLQTLGIKSEWLSTTKSVSQMAEIIALAVMLPISLRTLGMKATLVIGVLAWPARYFIFSLQHPLWLVVFSLTFHGIGFAFVFVTSQIFVDRIAPRDIRASAQSLLTLVTLGIGNLIGTLFCGWLKDAFTTFVPDPQHPGAMIPGAVNWPMVFAVPGILTTLCGIAFWLTFREPSGDTAVVSDLGQTPARA